MLPAPAGSGRPYRVALVCLGNICRSPMADVVLSDLVADAGLDVEVSSAGTGDYHVGETMDSRAAATLRGAGLDPSAHRAAQFTAADADRFDLVLAMDAANARALTALGVDPARLAMFRDRDPEGPGDVPDPYYTGDFDTVLAMVERTAAAWCGELATSVPAREGAPR